jgi:hypothetical protein
MQQHRDRQRAGNAAVRLASALTLLLLAFVLLPALAAAPGGAKANPRLESLQIDIWPEYDRPAALVILRAELAKDVALPAAVTLRLPASSGGPAAVAYAKADKDGLLNLKYDRVDAKDFVTLRFSVPERSFHVEFYDPISSGTSERKYRFVWPGDLPADRVNVLVQEPAQSSDFSVQPDLKDVSTGPDGLRYRSAQLGALNSGKAFPIEIRYIKNDTRTSAEILKPSGAPAAATPEPATAPQRADSTQLLLALGVVLPLLLAALTGYLWWRQRPRRSAERSGGGAGFCTKCGNPVAGGDRFCSKCGAAIG